MINHYYSIVFLFLLLPSVSNSQKSYFDQGMEKYDNGEYAEAIKLLHKELRFGESDAVTYYNLALNYSMIDSLELSNVYYDSAILKYPSFEQAYQQKGVNYLNMDSKSSLQKSIDMFTMCIIINDSSVCNYNRGLVLFLIGEYPAVIRDLEYSLDNLSLSLSSKINCYHKLVRSYAAIKEFDKAKIYLDKLEQLEGEKSSQEFIESSIWYEANKEIINRGEIKKLFQKLEKSYSNYKNSSTYIKYGYLIEK